MNPMSKYVNADGKKTVVAEGLADTLKVGEETYKRQSKKEALTAAVTPAPVAEPKPTATVSAPKK